MRLTGTLPYIYIPLLLPCVTGVKPAQANTGSRGYLGNCGSLKPSWHRTNNESFAEVILREWMQVVQSPALSACSCAWVCFLVIAIGGFASARIQHLGTIYVAVASMAKEQVRGCSAL